MDNQTIIKDLDSFIYVEANDSYRCLFNIETLKDYVNAAIKEGANYAEVIVEVDMDDVENITLRSTNVYIETDKQAEERRIIQKIQNIAREKSSIEDLTERLKAKKEILNKFMNHD